MRKRGKLADELRPEYDLRKLLKSGTRGKYAERYRAGTNLVLLEPDVARAFPNPKTVNEVLRLVLRLTQTPNSRKPTSAARRRWGP